MPLPPVVIVVNGLLLLVAILVALGMARAGMKYTLNIGDIERQKRLIGQVLRRIVLLIAIGLAAVFLNLLFA